MSIKRMLLLASMALAAIAFAAPAVAHGDIILTKDGEPIEEGEITATSTDLETVVPGGGTLSCQLVTLHFEITDPGPEHVVLSPTAPATTEGCEVTETGNPVTITHGTVGELTLDTWGHGEASATFISDLYKVGSKTHPIEDLIAVCHFEGSVTAQAEESENNVLNVGPSELEQTLETCPGATGTISGSFELETVIEEEEPTPVDIDFEETS